MTASMLTLQARKILLISASSISFQFLELPSSSFLNLSLNFLKRVWLTFLRELLSS